MFIYQAIILNSYSVICHSYCFSYECPFKKSSSGKRPKKKRFHGNRYEKKFKCESGTEFQKRSPEKSASAQTQNVPVPEVVPKPRRRAKMTQQLQWFRTWKFHFHRSPRWNLVSNWFLSCSAKGLAFFFYPMKAFHTKTLEKNFTFQASDKLFEICIPIVYYE
ncbi:unnamed protein product, partial [Larinioides sclopetarius]